MKMKRLVGFAIVASFVCTSNAFAQQSWDISTSLFADVKVTDTGAYEISLGFDFSAASGPWRVKATLSDGDTYSQTIESVVSGMSAATGDSKAEFMPCPPGTYEVLIEMQEEQAGMPPTWETKASGGVQGITG